MTLNRRRKDNKEKNKENKIDFLKMRCPLVHIVPELTRHGEKLHAFVCSLYY